MDFQYILLRLPCKNINFLKYPKNVKNKDDKTLRGYNAGNFE